MVDVNVIKEKYEQIQERIVTAARSVGRDPDDVKLIVVSKKKSPEVVAAAIQAGVRLFGENYPEEALEKISVLQKKAVPDISQVEWHAIGHLQSRKAGIVAQHFAYLHSLDSLKLAQRLDRLVGEAGKTLPVLLECNISGEESKYGFDARDQSGWLNLLAIFEQIAYLPNLSLRGLMTVPPFLPDPEQVRPYFRRLCDLQSFLRKNLPSMDWDELSMGMSADFEVAVQEGATWVRVGQAILGSRN